MKRFDSYRKTPRHRLILSFLAATLLGSFQSSAQSTTLISPSINNGGFENGFATWTHVGHASFLDANRWTIGAAAGPFMGYYSAYITTGSPGLPWAYVTTPPTQRTSHMYQDVTFPAGQTNVNMSFQWKSRGESGWDRILIYIAPTTLTPVEGVPTSPSNVLTGATLLWTQPTFTAASGANYNLASFSIPVAQTGNATANSDRRIIITYQSDVSVGSQPPGCIDNINLTSSTCTPVVANAVTAVTANTASANWTAMTGATGYEIRYKTASDPVTVGTWATPTSIAGGTTVTASLTALISNTVYEYQVRAVGASCTDFSPSIFFTTSANCNPPTALNITALTPTSVAFGWTAATGSPVNYQYVVSTSMAVPSTGTTATGTSATAGSLTPTTDYYLFVRTNCGGTDFSNWVGPIAFRTPCASVTAGTINAAPVACANTPHLLSLIGASTDPTITYKWQSRPTGGTTFTDVPGGIGSALSVTVATPTDFRCILTCGTNGVNATTPEVSITVNPFYFCYCKTGLGGTTAASIEKFKIFETTLDNPSPGSAPGFYTQYLPTGNTTATLQAGAFYNFTIDYGSNAIGSVWLDVNRNGTFESSEWIQLNTNGTSINSWIQVPANAQPGLTGLRIRSRTSGSANGATNACTNFTSGETEDYVVNIIPAPANDLRLLKLVSPANNSAYCANADIPFRAVIHNNGSTAQSNIKVYGQLTGPTVNSFIYNYPGTLAPFAKDTVTFLPAIAYTPGLHQMRAFTTSAVDNVPSNDTSAYNSFTIWPEAQAPVAFSDTACLGRPAMMHVFVDSMSHHWYNDYYAGTKVFTGDTMSIPQLMKDSVLFVAAQYPKNSLTTVTTGNVTCGGGIMFDITPYANITIDSFLTRFNSLGSQPVSIYYRQGTYMGFETSQLQWTQLGSTVLVAPTSTTALTRVVPSEPLVMQAGVTYGIYLLYDAVYSNGGNTYSNAEMFLESGMGLCSKFGGLNPGRTFNGTVHYHKGTTACPSPRTTVNAIVAAPPVVNLGPDIEKCEGAQITLDAGNPGASYVWSTQALDQKITAGTSGTYWVEVNRYCTATDTVVLDLTPLPDVKGISYSRDDNHVYKYTAAGLANVNRLLWYFGDGTTDTALSPEHKYPNGGTYTVKVVVFNECGADTAETIIPLDVTDMSLSNNISIYPNPTQNVLTVSTEANITFTEASVVNSLGAVVYQQKNLPRGKFEVNTSSLPSGHYIIRINTSEGVVNRPFQVIR